MRITIHPEAERDLREAAEFYEREGSPLVAILVVKYDSRRPGYGGKRS
jgi:hypothetical protein